MNTILLHLSDLHFKLSANNPLFERSEQISAAVGSVSNNDIDHCFIVVSGDIAFSGQNKEYEIAEKFFGNLLEELQVRLTNCTFRFIFVPGNHDCDFSSPNQARGFILSSLNYENIDEIDESIISQLISCQKNYANFISHWEQKSNFIYENVKVDTCSGGIEFHLLNSAWMSTLQEQQGSLLFPVSKIISNDIETKKSPFLVVTVFHHPSAWFESNNSRKLRTLIEGISDVILTGHEHEGDVYSKVRHNNQEVEYVEGGVLQDGFSKHSRFNLLLIDPIKKDQTIYDFSWNDRDQQYKYLSSNTLPLKRNSNRLRNDYILSNGTEKYLADPGAEFTHPNVGNIYLNDIFVYPKLRQLHLPGDPQLMKTVVNVSAIEFTRQQKQVLIVGSEKSGKTAFTKMLFQDFCNIDLVPLLIPGEDLKECDQNFVLKIIKRHFEKMYSSPEFSSFEQLVKEKKIIIIDDFHKCPMNNKGRDQILQLLRSRFDVIILLGDEHLRFIDLVSIKSEQDLFFRDFTTCEIMEFGRLKRAELIKKWYSLGRIYTLDETVLGQEIVKVEKIVTSLIGQNFIPQHPIFVLMILQQLELRNPVDTNSGSFGYLYEALITTTFSKARKKEADIDIQYSYLSELAYHMFSKRVHHLNRDELEPWHHSYCQSHKLILDRERTISDLLQVSILSECESGISFRYSYIYYYFVARYLKDHIVDVTAEAEIKKHIRWMSERLHHTESANIIICLCYLSKDPYILTTLIKSSSKLFETYSECDLDSDTKFLSNLIPDVPRLDLYDNDPIENHKKSLAENDEMETQIAEKNTSDISLEKRDRELQEIVQINVAFKTIQILGQLLRNFPSLKGEQKFALARECYSLGLRVLTFMLDTMKENRQEIVEVFAGMMRERFPKWQYEKVNQEVKSIIFSMVEGFSFVVVRHISDSVGLELLSMTYQDLLQSTNNISYKQYLRQLLA